MLDRMAPAVLLAIAGVAVAGCGKSTDYAKDPRPAAVVTVGVGIDQNRVLVSPNRLGGGQIALVVANNTQASQQVMLTSLRPGVLREQTGPINPGDTATLQAQLQPGGYQVQVADPTIRPALLVVGAQRSGAANPLLLP